MNKFLIPGSFVLAGLIIAGAIVFSGGTGADTAQHTTAADNQPQHSGGDMQQPSANPPADSFRMPSAADHVRGDRDAAVQIVEFSDFECPFCGRLHPTLQRIVQEEEDVAWVYRHFPLSIHSNAAAAAVASECIAELGGNDAFWNFADSAFANQRQLGRAFYEDVAQSQGINIDDFADCLESERFQQDVQDDLDEVLATGGRGTPFVVVLTAGGGAIPFSGALPYEQVMSVVERARTQ